MDKLILPNNINEIIIDYWKKGYTVQQIVKLYVKNQKQKGLKIKAIEAQKCIEPIIFNYQKELLKK